jgi:hypothetical protein
MDITQIWARNKTLRTAFRECIQCLNEISKEIRVIVRSPKGTPKEFAISSKGLPESLHSVGRNLFSTLFHSVYLILDIPKPRRMLYGKLNYLFRIWVTSADNLLDNENKHVIDLSMPGDSMLMRQVIQIMTADRVMKRILDNARYAGTITEKESGVLSDVTLGVLLPSAAEEALEEGGVIKRPRPEVVLRTFHRLKTTRLFHVPLLGPERVEKRIDHKVLKDCRKGLRDFGLGCQMLDDIRDIACDYLERRHNYVLSRMFNEDKKSFARLKRLKPRLRVTTPVYNDFRMLVEDAARHADKYLISGLRRLDACGLGLGDNVVRNITDHMYKALDVEKVRMWMKHL